MQLEFRYLAKHTGKQKFADAAENAIKVLEKHAKPNGLYPIYISPQTGAVRGSSGHPNHPRRSAPESPLRTCTGRHSRCVRARCVPA